MAIRYKSHGRSVTKPSPSVPQPTTLAAAPAAGDITTDDVADFGYLFRPPAAEAAENDFLAETQQTVDDLDALGNAMIDLTKVDDVDASPDASVPPAFTYWGQFLDHELTARTDRDGAVTDIENPLPELSARDIETRLKNARSPRFDLDSVYGGVPLGTGISSDAAVVISGMRHPVLRNKMRVGTAHGVGPLPDDLDAHRDLPRYGQVDDAVRQASLRLARQAMSEDDFQKFEAGLDKRALIGDMRNDENLIVAQFHLSVLRFHNRAVDFMEKHDTGWVADFQSAQLLTRLHYQWLTINQYLKTVCDASVVDRVLSDRASQFFQFRERYAADHPSSSIGNAIPIEFSAAIYRFGHTMVRNIYDYNSNFGRSDTGPDTTAKFVELFNFTGAGGFRGLPKLPENWVIDWSRFVGTNPHDASDGLPARNARAMDTLLAPPLGEMQNDGNEFPEASDLRALFKHLARRNLRRGLNLRLPTGQALHRYLKKTNAVTSDPISDVSALFQGRPDMQQFLRNTPSRFHERTPLWFYCLAEAEAGGGQTLGELGSWMVASTFIGVMHADPDSALSRRFKPENSPLRMPDGSPVDSLEKWMRFAVVMP